MEFNEICNVLINVCEHGNLSLLEPISKYLTHVHVNNKNNFAFRVACSNGHLEVVQWLVDTFELTIADAKSFNNEALRIVCYYERLNILQFLIGRFQMSEDDYNQTVNWYWTKLITNACKEENRFMVSWFLTKFPKNEILLNDIPEECKIFVEEVLNEHDVMIKPASKHAIN